MTSFIAVTNKLLSLYLYYLSLNQGNTTYKLAYTMSMHVDHYYPVRMRAKG